MNQCEKCPMKVIEDYNKMKKDTELDFMNYITKWFDTHPYVDKIYISNRGSYYSDSMFLRSDKNVSCKVYIKQ